MSRRRDCQFATTKRARRARRQRQAPYRRYLLIGSLAAAALVIVLARVLGLPLYPGWIASLSAVTLALYGLDKRRSIVGGERVPEMVLHVLALAGGFPGGWAGRTLLRHKARRTSFLFVLALATVLHALIIWRLYVA